MDFKVDGTADELQARIEWLAECCLEHPQDVPKIARVVGWHDNRGDHDATDDGTEYALWETPDGKFAVLEAGEDYTGHGCQCGSSVQVFDTIDDAMKLGLGEAGRVHLVKAEA